MIYTCKEHLQTDLKILRILKNLRNLPFVNLDGVECAYYKWQVTLYDVIEMLLRCTGHHLSICFYL